MLTVNGLNNILLQNDVVKVCDFGTAFTCSRCLGVESGIFKNAGQQHTDVLQYVALHLSLAMAMVKGIWCWFVVS